MLIRYATYQRLPRAYSPRRRLCRLMPRLSSAGTPISLDCLTPLLAMPRHADHADALLFRYICRADAVYAAMLSLIVMLMPLRRQR